MTEQNSKKSLEDRVSDIEERNRRVELGKAWETSWTRRFLLLLFTYLSIALYLKFVVRVEPWLNAIVPAIGFLLSTLTLPFFKKLWEEYIHKS